MIVVYRTVRWSQRNIPTGVRSLLGVLAMACGVFGFLPILGFWMFPLGIALIMTDFPPLRRRLERWLNDTRRKYHMDQHERVDERRSSDGTISDD